MEIGTEISRKIRGAIKGKLQELGAYVDEELPDYIMVMVANKKSQEQMTEDLSLFLGNNTVRFTVWLHGVLDKLRSVTTEPTSVKSSESSIFESSLPSSKSSSCVSDERRREDTLPPLAVSSTRTERNDSRVSTSSQEQRNTASRQSCEDGSASRLTSAVKPLRELSPSEAVIDIKPEPDDLIDEDLNFVQENPLSRKKPIEESSRKRRLPVVSSVVKVKKFCNDGEDEEEEEDYGSRTGSISSSVSVPAKPERRPSLPPSKQANKNLILKAISEAQESVTKTTNYSTVPQKQTVPVAPRTRISPEESQLELIHVQSRLPALSSQLQAEEPKERIAEGIQGAEQKELSARLQIDPAIEDTLQVAQDYYDIESMVHADTRSFILKKPKLSEEILGQNQQLGRKATEAMRVLSGRLIQTRVFPNCRFADKCLFIHPNCKYDAKCTKPDCPYTHASRRLPHTPPKPAPLPTLSIPSSSPLCKFFPACKKMECPFYHPKHCRFNTQCTRPDCTFYHPTIAVPPRRALKWTRAQTSE
uniref:Zinc finger CCCH domain-containing protein 14 n=1 Tax=Amazona collaria TaxID=241587 RepID=A0A8B9G3U1_9PSIT